jgi:hypothetical protein
MMYVRPDCKVPLQGLACTACGLQFPSAEGFPNFLHGDSRFERVGEMSARYDIIYEEAPLIGPHVGIYVAERP